MDKVYVLQHSYEDGSHEDTKMIGVYSTKQLAESAIKRMLNLPGFRDYSDGFVIDEYKLNEDNWAEGFGV